MIASASGRSISPDDLGVTLMHEHLFVFDAERRLAHPDRYHDDDILRVVLDQLASAHLAGVRTIVDASSRPAATPSSCCHPPCGSQDLGRSSEATTHWSTS